MRRIVALLAAAAMAGGLLALAAALWDRSDSFLIETWREELERAPDSQVDAILDRLAAMDDAAIPALAAALASDRECVARGAARVVRGQLVRWRSLAIDDAMRRERRLAKALADGWPHYGPEARHAAAGIVAQLLSGSPPESRLDGGLLAACVEMLRADASSTADRVQPAAAPAPTVAANGNSPATIFPIRPEQPELVRLCDWLMTTPDRPGVDARARPDAPRFALPADSPTDAPLPPAPGASGTAARSPSNHASGLANPSQGPAGAGSQAASLDDALGSAPSAASNAPRRLSSVQRAAFEDRSPPQGSGDAGGKAVTDLRQLARRLHDEDTHQAEAARNELRRRGFSAVEVELAKQLTCPDPTVRIKMARNLPATPGVDAAPWLLELARDADADVRIEAITLLATSGDPALLNQLRKLVAADTDERIQGLAERLSRPGLRSTNASGRGASP